MQRFDVVVIGGGAAGLMCAVEAGKRGRKTAVIEHNAEIGRKILISGGGRCNFTNIHCGPEHFLSANPHFCKSALARYQPADFIALVRKHHIPYHEKKLGQLFCDGSARGITSMLVEECRAAGVVIQTGCRVTEVRRTTEFVIESERGAFHAPVLVVASGGLSIPKIGATDLGYRLARQFALRVHEPRPALVPLTFSRAAREKYGLTQPRLDAAGRDAGPASRPDGEKARFRASLAGVSADVIASVGPVSFREKMLFTHRGLSGPAILQISSYWPGSGAITIDLLPEVDIVAVLFERRRAGDRAETKTILSQFLPARLAERWLEVNASSKPLSACCGDELRLLSERLHRWEVTPAGTEGFEKAEVTAAGVDTSELSSKTMEAKRVPGLFFIGEVVDVTGWLGGFNFQWAWASGYLAGQAL